MKPAALSRLRVATTAMSKTRPHGRTLGDAVVVNICRRNPSVTKLSDAESRKLHEQITATAIELVAIDAVKRNPRNAKQHPEQQILLIAENIRKSSASITRC